MEAKRKVTRMADYTGNTLQLSREQVIEEFQKYLKDNPQIKKVFLLALDTNDGYFIPTWRKAQMLNSEALAALDIVHNELAQSMGG